MLSMMDQRVLLPGSFVFELTLFLFPGPPSVSYSEFVSEGWRREGGKVPRTEDVLKARELELQPLLERNSSSSEVHIYLDCNTYEQ